MTEKQRHEIMRLRREGLGYTAVANRLGISKDTVKSFCRRNGLAGELKPVQGICRECGQPLPQNVPGKVVAGASRPHQAKSGVLFHLCLLWEIVHGLWQCPSEILLP